MPDSWVNKSFDTLPGTDDLLFRRLWVDRLLVFDGDRDIGDNVDNFSARLVSAAIRRKERLLIALPDSQPHRAALLFATALLRYWDDCRNSNDSKLKSRPIIYFGSSVGIRDQLSRTIVRPNVCLAKVFPQYDLSRGAGKATVDNLTNGLTELPRVVTIYAPSDPVAIVRSSQPSWIAIDCSDASSLNWMGALLSEAKTANIPVIAWGHNHLSDCFNDFASIGNTFIWPFRTTTGTNDPHGEPASVLNSANSTYLAPIILSGKRVDTFSKRLQEATHLLISASNLSAGRLVKDALSVHWRYLRSLEGLIVPMEFYEAEAPRFWGLQSFNQLRLSCEQFRCACTNNTSLCSKLVQVSSLLELIHDDLKVNDSPMWHALCDLCTEESAPNEAQVFVFSSDSRKRLFLFALLARCNISEEALYDNNIWVTSLNDVRGHSGAMTSSKQNGEENQFIPPRTKRWRIVLAGLPFPNLTPKLSPIFLHDLIDIFLYPHQFGALKRRRRQWADQLGADPTKSIKSLIALNSLPMPTVTFKRTTRVRLLEVAEMSIEEETNDTATYNPVLWEANETAEEIALLFKEDDSPDENVVFNDESEGQNSSVGEGDEINCADAIEISFDQGWRGQFSSDDKLNLIVNAASGRHVEQRFVRSVRPNDMALIISGQHRQSLYELIISRVYTHPSMELHLTLIRRWQEELRVAYPRWHDGRCLVAELDKYGERNLLGLLRRMRERGCNLGSPQVLTSWLRGWTLCPQDPENLRRLSEILDIPFVAKYYNRIADAANRLRGIHIGLSRKLNRWVESQALGLTNKGDDDLIDGDLGLTFGDVRSSLLILRVKDVRKVSGLFLRDRLGYVEKAR